MQLLQAWLWISVWMQHVINKGREMSLNLNHPFFTPCVTFVLCGSKTWSLTLREKCRLRVFESTVLRRIFGPKRDEVTGEWRRLHNEELYAVYSSPNIIRVIKSRRLRWAGHVACVGERRGANRVLVGKADGRRPLGRRRRRREDNIKMDFWEMGWGPWTGSIWLRIGTGNGLLLIR